MGDTGMIMELLVALGLIALTAMLVLLLRAAVLSCSHRGRALRGLDFLAYSIAFGVLALAALGAAVVSVSYDYQLNAWLLLGISSLLAGAQWYRNGLLARFWNRRALGMGEQPVRVWIAMTAWLLMASISMLLTFLPVKMPAELPDGAYVIKNSHVHVKVQVMLGGFPADNYIPFVASEYLLRDIPFSEERPLMPGQELANRPILMSLVAIPLGAALYAPPRDTGAQPTFKYLGKRWPDVGRFGDDHAYRSFLAVALLLNATLLIGLALLLQYFGLRQGYWIAGLLLFLTSPYFVGQTLFVWPKSLAAFYVLLAGYTLITKQRSGLVGLMLVVAYWAHPYALVFMFSFALYLLIRERNDMDPRRGLLPFALVAGAGVLAWRAWAGWYLQIPADLIEQNLAIDAPLLHQLYVRLINCLNTIVPFDLAAGSFPGDLMQMSLLGLVGGVGVFFLPQALLGSMLCVRRQPTGFLVLVVLPAAAIITVFGELAVPALHGLQAVTVTLLVLSLYWMQQKGKMRWMVLCVCLQVIFNSALFLQRGHALMHG